MLKTFQDTKNMGFFQISEKIHLMNVFMLILNFIHNYLYSLKQQAFRTRLMNLWIGIKSTFKFI